MKKNIDEVYKFEKIIRKHKLRKEIEKKLKDCGFGRKEKKSL